MDISKVRAEVRHLMCWTLKGWREAIFAGRLKVSPLLSCPAPPAFGLATQAENLICSAVHIVCGEKNHSRSQIRRGLLSV